MSNFQGLYDIRSAVPDDYNFIIATWLRGLYYGDTWFSEVPKNIFMDKYKQIANAYLTSPNVKINVACLKEDPDVILGYSIVTRNDEAIIWVFVKTAWRKQGIGKSLIPPAPKYVVLLTTLGKSLMSKIPTAVFNPFY